MHRQVKAACVAMALRHHDLLRPHQIVGTGVCTSQLGVIVTSDEVLASFLNLAIDRYRVEIDAKQPSAEKQNSVTTIPQAFFFADEQESPLLGK